MRDFTVTIFAKGKKHEDRDNEIFRDSVEIEINVKAHNAPDAEAAVREIFKVDCTFVTENGLSGDEYDYLNNCCEIEEEG